MITTKTVRPPRHAAFTRLELCIVLVILAALTVVTGSAWGFAGRSSRTLLCLENLRRLAAAWAMYAPDNRGTFVDNSGTSAVPTPGNPGWISGQLDWSISPGNTNTLYLTDPRYALIAPYAGSDPSLFKCPADDNISAAQARKGWPARVRSYSMNYYVGLAGGGGAILEPQYVNYTRFADLQKLSPADLFVFVEEHPDSINDGMFITSMSRREWIDFPASFHDGGAWFTFADAHVELHHWLSPPTVMPIRKGPISLPIVTAEDPDYAWVKAHATERR